ncbi:MAG: hypothetical protein RBS07_03010 [Lentimicrobium sp.]|jgi:hypothetical protein|nr:hypothetical protein [Lentimicrobium sp.]
MIRKFRNFSPLFLLLVFLLPTIVKLEHHHEDEHHIYKTENEQHYHKFHKKCAICDFEFSIFTLNYEIVELREEKPSGHYYLNYAAQFFSGLSEYSFLLRAPPFFQI